MLSDSEKELILDLAKKANYQGFHHGTFYVWGNKTTSERTLWTKLGFPGAFNFEGLYRVGINWPILQHFVKDLLISVPRKSTESSYEQNESAGSKKMLAELKNIKFYKTFKQDGVFDSGAGKTGINLLAFNILNRTLLSSRKISFDGMLRAIRSSRDQIIEDDTIPYVWPVFNPYTPDLHFPMEEEVFGDREILALNTAIPPRWMTHASKDVGPGVTGFISKLLNHLFPVEEDRERVLDWCHYAIFQRNGTVLCLAGARGTGKSTFIEILGEMVGAIYTETVSDAILKDKFNAQFLNKRLIVFEEVALEDQSSINKIKAWCNNKISVEEKGKDAFSADNYSSMVFLINRLQDLNINAQERRFSIPVVAEENLLTIISEREVSEFKQALVDKEQWVLDELAAFGLFLKERKPKFSEHIPIRGENFNRVADLAMVEWQSHLRDYVAANGEVGVPIPITDIFPLNKDKDAPFRMPHKRSTIENFLGDYRYLGKYKIGDLKDMEESEVLSTNPKIALIQKSKPKRTRRAYALIPREDFLQLCGSKYKEVEDLL